MPTTAQPWRQKWGDDFFASRGYTQLPNALLEYARVLQLGAQDLAVIAAVLYWKFDNRRPYPSVPTIAQAAACSERTVQRVLHRLEQRGLVELHSARKRDGRQGANLVDFRALRKRINKLSRIGLPAWAHDHFRPAQRPIPVLADDQDA